MRSVAMARYRFLTTVRGTRWIFPFFFAAIAIPLAFAHIPLMMSSDNDLGVTSAVAFGAASDALMWAYVIHAFGLSLLCASFGKGVGTPHSLPTLLETIPISGQSRFWGNAIGIFCSAMALHLCTTPLLALAVAISPFTSRTFWIAEAMFAVMAFYFSAAAAWSLAAFDTKQGASAKPPVLLASVLMTTLVIIGTTRPGELAESIAYYVTLPSDRTWQAVVASVTRPKLLAAMLFGVYALFVAFFSIDTTRLVEEQE